MDLTLNNLQMLICHKTQTPKNQPTKQPTNQLRNRHSDKLSKYFIRNNIFREETKGKKKRKKGNKAN